MARDQDVKLFEFLDADTRPTFVLDAILSSDMHGLDPIFQNKTLLAEHALLMSVHGKQSSGGTAISWQYTYRDYFHWVVHGESSESQSSTYAFQGYLWNRFIFQGRWIVLSATIFSNFAGRIVPGASAHGESLFDGKRRRSTPLSRKNSTDVMSTRSLESDISSRIYKYDWTRMDFDKLDGHLQYARGIDWATTALGAIEDWSQELRTITNMCFVDSEPMLLYWGPERTVLYNSSYIDLIAASHPCMGKPALEAFPEYADFMATIFDRTGQTGQTFAVDDLPIFLKTSDGYMQEEYLCLKMIPIINSADEVVGVYQRGSYSTARICHERRLETLKNLTVQTANARQFADFWPLIFRALKDNDKDIMFAMAYSNTEMCSPTLSAKQWHDDMDLCSHFVLRGHLGIASDHPAAVDSFGTKMTDDGFMPWFRKAGASGKHIILRAEDSSLPAELLCGITSREYEDACRAVVISPLRYADSTPIVGFLVVGSNPRTKVDSAYVEFQRALTTTVGTYMGSLVRFGEIVAQRDASVAEANAEQAKLSEELKEIRLRVVRTEKLLRHFVETSSVGVFVLDSNARYIYRNHGWSRLTNETGSTTLHEAWDEMADPDFLDYLHKEWNMILAEKRPRRYEFKTLNVWEPSDDVCLSSDHDKEHRVWLMVSAVPDIGPDGEVTQVLGSVTDISALKWANKVHQREADEAIESKRLKDQLVDTINHELRNPLSAVLLASDDIINSVSQAIHDQSKDYWVENGTDELLKSLMENARTIASCTRHQKRIVDDVLTASKLEAMLLQISPSSSDPEQEIRDCIQIFKADAGLARVQVEFTTSDQYNALKSNFFMLDTTRFIQIFMNLLTNAMKFTKFESTRLVEVRLDISTTHPSSEHSLIKLIPPVNTVVDPTTSPEWTDGPQIYLIVHVKDSGKGLTPLEADSLFNRFTQASPKTHVRYGGSGLGLFISRRLAELHGGAIGLKSKAGVGSTFSYFVKCRHCPQDPLRKPKPTRGNAVQAFSTAISRRSADDLNGLSSLIQPTRLRSDGSKIKDSTQANCVNTIAMLHILVVEDNLINQRMLAKQLYKLGCTVLLANHGAEAIEQIENSKWGNTPTREITIVLMDWEMPVLDGLASTRIIRDRERSGSLTGHIPVLGVTANVRKEQIQRAIDAGMDDIVCKPFHIPELIDKIFSVLEKVNATRENATLTHD